MLKALKNDIFWFSGLKTHAQLFEASRQLLNSNKKLKSFIDFEKDIKGVNNSHKKYLEAEYNFAHSSLQMAEKWGSFSDNDRYLLQYRTAKDGKVRPEHAVLHNITLPKNSSFWNKYFPPNGWNCRCTTVEVLKSTNTANDSGKSEKLGEKATTKIGKNGKNKLEIFRFNAGKEKVIFPKNHPYHKLAGASKVKSITNKIKK